MRWIGEESARSGCDLLAFAVMPNHLHIVAVQGARPLAALMHPLLRRLALLVHARHGTEGHVFQRRYHSVPCTDPDYLRNAIAYVHLNPVRAGLCAEPDQYSWTTHLEYCAIASTVNSPRRGFVGGLELFSPFLRASPADLQDGYRSFLQWRLFLDQCAGRAKVEHGMDGQAAPPTTGGDIYWAERFGSSCTSLVERRRPHPPLLDLRDLALRFLAGVDPDMTLDQLRSGYRSRALVTVRRQFINRAKETGHRHCSIARFLHVSDVTVSRS